MATETQGEHTFPVEVLVSGEKLRSYTADEALTAGEPVSISADNTVEPSTAGGDDFLGVVLYDVADGEEVTIAESDCEVRIEVSEAVTANEELVPDGVGTFESVGTSAATDGVALAQEGASSGETVIATLFSVQGSEA